MKPFLITETCEGHGYHEILMIRLGLNAMKTECNATLSPVLLVRASCGGLIWATRLKLKARFSTIGSS